MIFNGGLVPFYMVIQKIGLMDSFWVLVLPGAVNTFLVILMLNFFRGIPKELEEAALIDGANHFRTLFSIFLPISMPSIATIALFSMVFHWNSWFDGLFVHEQCERLSFGNLHADGHYQTGYEYDGDESKGNGNDLPNDGACSPNLYRKCADSHCVSIPATFLCKGMTLGSVKAEPQSLITGG